MMPHTTKTTPQKFETVRIPRILSRVYLAAVLFYATWWLDFSHVGSWVLYGALLIAEIYHVWQVVGYLYTVWRIDDVVYVKPKEYPPVDIFITVCGEPREIVEQTVAAAKLIDYPDLKVHILNDGLVAGMANWRDIEDLGRDHNVDVITRTTPGGAKAGNINHALSVTTAPFFALFDADHVPHKDYLMRTIGHMNDPKMAFVQTPQYYKNRDDNFITRGAWEQQELFFGPICQGKNRMNATFWCGTNALIRRRALLDAGGVPEKSIAEDFLASLFIHERGWKSLYLPEILAHGLAPIDLEAYSAQQYRWARGSLDVMFKYNPLFRKGLTFAQKMQYLYSAGYYLNGLVVLMDAFIPLFFLFFGVVPVDDYTGNLVIYFAPFIFLTLYFLIRSTAYTITFRAIQLTIAASFVFLMALIASVTGKQTRFKVTSKVVHDKGNFISYAIPNMVYVLVGVIGVVFALNRDGVTPAVITNASWVLFNVVFFWPFIQEAYPWRAVATDFVQQAMGIFKKGPLVSSKIITPSE